MFKILTNKSFDTAYKKRVTGNSQVEKRAIKTIQQLRLNPHHTSLRSHRVTTKQYGKKWSSWVTGDIRIIWELNVDSIALYDIGPHTGKHKVYK